MGILAKLFGAKSETTAKPVEHAVIVAFTYIGSTDLGPLFALERQLESDIAAAQAGEGCTREASLWTSSRRCARARSAAGLSTMTVKNMIVLAAVFYLKNCPGTQMDADEDGIPCESQHCGH